MMMQLSAVADDLHLIFFPAEQRFLDQHFGGRRAIEAAADDLLELLAVVRDAAARAAHGEAGADDRGRPVRSSAANASASVCAMPERALSSPILSIASRNLIRSSALSIASASAPII
jgi:hypothetical protein